MQLRQLAIRVRGTKYKIIAGDLYGVDSCELDRQPVDKSREEANRNANAMKIMGVEDTFRKVNGNRKDYTYRTGKARRLNRIYATPNIKPVTRGHFQTATRP